MENKTYRKVLCSERLPDIGHYYYVWIDTKQDHILETICEYAKWPNGQYDWDLDGIQHFPNSWGEDAEVIAWLEEVTESPTPASMTLQEAKNQVAVEFGYKGFFDCLLQEHWPNAISILTEVAELYAASKTAALQKELEAVEEEKDFLQKELDELRKPVDGDWKLVGHSYALADTGDYDGHWEITNGKFSIFSGDDNDEALQLVVNALNSSKCKFYLDESSDINLHFTRLDLKESQSHAATLQNHLEDTKQYYEDKYEALLRSRDEIYAELQQSQSRAAALDELVNKIYKAAAALEAYKKGGGHA